MPILGLTDRSASFKEIGRLRLGIPKSEATTSGPKEISYFRPDFRPDALDLASVFETAYGKKPTQINIRLPFQEISRCWDAFYMCYNKTGLLGMADGERWLYLRHNQTGKLLVKDGVPETTDGCKVDPNGSLYMPFDKTIPVYSYKSKAGKDVAVFAKPEGRLKVLIPELKRAAFMTVITHSVYNVMRLSEQLAGIEQVARGVGMSIPMVPMILSRRPEMISVSIDGKKAMQEHYLLNIEIDPAWMEAQFTYLNSLKPGAMMNIAMLAPVDMTPRLPAPEPKDLEEDDEYIEPDTEEDGDLEYHEEYDEDRKELAAELVVNPDPPTDEAWEYWDELVEEANHYGIANYEDPDPDTITMAELRDKCKALLAEVKKHRPKK